MFIFSDKKFLRASLLVDDQVFRKQVISSRINGFSILFFMIGGWFVYWNNESTPLIFWSLIGCSLIGLVLLADAHFENKFYKELLDAQSDELLFSQEELIKIQKSLSSNLDSSDQD